MNLIENMFTRKFFVGAIYYLIFLTFILFTGFILGWEQNESLSAVTNSLFLFGFLVYAPFWSIISEGLSELLYRKEKIKYKKIRKTSLLFHIVGGPLFLFFFPLLESNLEEVATNFYSIMLYLFLTAVPAFFFWCIEESMLQYNVNSKG